MTKVEAIKQLMKNNGGAATWKQIYDNIEKYYPNAKLSKDWEAGLRGTLYREIKNQRNFKRIGLSLYSLAEYEEEKTPSEKNKIRIHSYMEGLCIELGNNERFNTFTADPSQLYRDNTFLKDIVSLDNIPNFTYPDILKEARFIDVLWFDNSKNSFPQYAFEIVDSIGTLDGAFSRCFQLCNFRTKFFIVAPEKHRDKYDKKINLEIYKSSKDFFKFKSYEEINETYDILVNGAKKINWLK